MLPGVAISQTADPVKIILVGIRAGMTVKKQNVAEFAVSCPLTEVKLVINEDGFIVFVIITDDVRPVAVNELRDL